MTNIRHDIIKAERSPETIILRRDQRATFQRLSS